MIRRAQINNVREQDDLNRLLIEFDAVRAACLETLREKVGETEEDLRSERGMRDYNAPHSLHLPCYPPDKKPYMYLHLLEHREHPGLIPMLEPLTSSTFAMTCKFHWPWKDGDDYLQSLFSLDTSQECGPITSIQAVGGSGKTAHSFRALSSNYGLYLTCTHYEEADAFGLFCDDLMVNLHKMLLCSSQEELHLYGLSYCQIAMIVRLSLLIQRTQKFFSANHRMPSPEEFLFWQVNQFTREMGTAFKIEMKDARVRLASATFLRNRMTDLYTKLTGVCPKSLCRASAKLCRALQRPIP